MPQPQPYVSIRSLADMRVHLRDEASARQLLEWLVWPDGRFCPHCSGLRHWRLNGRRSGLYECRECGGQFTATTRTPMHATKLPTATWLEAAFLVLASSKGVSSVALARHLGVSQRTAWKLGHALRLMMRPGPGEAPLDGVVEVDDVADGGNPARRNRARYGAAMAKHIYNPRGRGADKQRILVAAQRGGRARATPITDGSQATVEPAVRALVAPEAHLMTDGDRTLAAVGKTQARHDAVDHSSGEYVRGDAHVNTAEAFNLYLRRAKMGVWHVWSKEHLRRYLEELQFHWDHRPCMVAKGRSRIVVHATPVIVRMRQLFSRAFGRELRRTINSGIREVDRAWESDPF